MDVNNNIIITVLIRMAIMTTGHDSIISKELRFNMLFVFESKDLSPKQIYVTYNLTINLHKTIDQTEWLIDLLLPLCKDIINLW